MDDQRRFLRKTLTVGFNVTLNIRSICNELMRLDLKGEQPILGHDVPFSEYELGVVKEAFEILNHNQKLLEFEVTDG